ncbi:MAG: hypothetical protein CMP53_02355 [Flavobacteriales bacterium]|nr:hypothetical protein [Flavobacteriales bacterium]|tara:strand:- start:1728 stop:2162 length:435 start_codon:yes stop_codon:yes gene_type:complete
MEKMIAFNARCYAIIKSQNNRVLVMKERWHGVDLQKFPGGGLELGEGLLECISREIEEEFRYSQTLEYVHCFTPTDCFSSRFKPREQLLLNYFTNTEAAQEDQWELIANDENLLGIQWLELTKENAYWFTLDSDKNAFLSLLSS